MQIFINSFRQKQHLHKKSCFETSALQSAAYRLLLEINCNAVAGVSSNPKLSDFLQREQMQTAST